MIQAIETAYKGYRFRSRLEARWAVFFDTLGIRWEYEREGYDLGAAGWYLPDFWLPDMGVNGFWLEVKGEEPAQNSDARRKLAALCIFTGKMGLLVHGTPYGNIEQTRGIATVEWTAYFPEGGDDTPYLFCVCPWCGQIGIEFDGRGARVCHHAPARRKLPDAAHLAHWSHDKYYTGDAPRIEAAALQARQARF